MIRIIVDGESTHKKQTLACGCVVGLDIARRINVLGSTVFIDVSASVFYCPLHNVGEILQKIHKDVHGPKLD